MKKIGFLILVAALAFFSGCSKESNLQGLEEGAAPQDEGVTIITSENSAIATAGTETAGGATTDPQTATVAPSTTAAEFVRPSEMDIQTALNNAGYYKGAIDGKVGPKTKKAIEDFQQASGLTADGKVGPKTWSALIQYLNPAPTSAEPVQR